MCFVFISEQRATCATYCITLWFYNLDFKSLQPSGQYIYHQFYIQILYALLTLYL
jgi:hypothetical protein